jgi:hypothetical protein
MAEFDGGAVLEAQEEITATTRKDGTPCEMPPNGSDLLKIWLDIQITASSLWNCLGLASCPALPCLRHDIRRKSFVAAFASLVADSLESLGSAFFCWKISLPMK